MAAAPPTPMELAAAGRSDASPPDPSASDNVGRASPAVSYRAPVEASAVRRSDAPLPDVSASENVGGASAALSAQVQCRLNTASREAKRRIRRITVPCLLVGTVLLLFGVLLRYMAGSIFQLLPWWWKSPAVLISGFGIISMLLAVVPTQIRSIWFVTGGFALIGMGILALNAARFLTIITGTVTDEFVELVGVDAPRWYVYTALILRKGFQSGPALLFAGCLRLILRRPPPRRHLDELWMIMAGAIALIAAQYGVSVAIDAAVGCMEPEDYLMQVSDAPCFALLAVLTAWPGLRVRVQAWLATQGSRMSVATAVGALVSLRPLDKLLPLATRRFRCVPLDRITRAMMASNEPDVELAALSEPARLGKVDAFLSHSWSDDAGDKWEQLQAWRTEFRAAAGREPRVWIDKFCLDQGDILDSLAGLPIFLAGCDRLVVLQGETYLTRLWCLLEVFTFIVMGGSSQNLEIRQLHSCSVGFDSFDARKATCFNDSDKIHLLGIIETGLGTMEAFNSAVRDMVGKQPSLALTPASGAAATEPPGQEDSEVALDGSDEDLADALDRVIVFEDEEMFTF